MSAKTKSRVHASEEQVTRDVDQDPVSDYITYRVLRIELPLRTDKREFNVNDILGDLDRDLKGKVIVIKDGESCIDKRGRRVN